MAQANGRLPPRPWAPAALLGFLAALMILARPGPDVEDDGDVRTSGRGEAPPPSGPPSGRSPAPAPSSAPSSAPPSAAPTAAAAPGSPAVTEKPEATEAPIVNAAKWVIQFAGIVGGGTTGLAALSFAIGYLATKSHDAMLGLPTVSISATSYVRTGALFFTNSLQNLSLLPRPSLAQGCWVLASGVVLGGLALWVGKRSYSVDVESVAYVFAYLLFLGLLILYTPHHLSPLDPQNKDVLVVATEGTKDTRDDLPHALAARIRDDLKSSTGEDPLRSLYAVECVVAMGAVYATVMMERWRRRLQRLGKPLTSATGGVWATSDALARPVIVCLTAILVSALPATYGVLMLSNRYPCVEITNKPETGKPAALPVRGFLLSDLSAETDTVTVLEFKGNKYVDHFLERKAMAEMEITDCGGGILTPRTPQ